MTLVLEWRAVSAIETGWVPQPDGPVLPAAIVGPPGRDGNGDAREPLIAPGTAAQYWRGDKIWAVLDKAAVALGNVDNTSDATKPVSTAVQAALDGKQPLAAVLSATTASFTAAKDAKLAGVAAGATANDTDASLKARANHSGTQSVSTITGNWPVAQLNGGAGANATTFWRGDGSWASPPGSPDPLNLTNAPTLPASGSVTIGVRRLAGADMLAMRSAQGSERIVQPHLGRTTLVKVDGTSGATALSFIGVHSGTFTLAGTLTARPTAATSRATRAKRTGLVSAAAAGSIAGLTAQSSNTPGVTMGTGAGLGGFHAIIRWVPSDAATVTGARQFIGLRAQSFPTNVEPSTLTNHIGVAQLSTSANLFLVYGGSAAQAAIDLGANFPAGGLSADLYELMLFADPNDATQVSYRVERLNTGHIAEGGLTNTVPGTTLPASTQMLGLGLWRTNNATALAVGVDLVAMSILSDN